MKKKNLLKVKELIINVKKEECKLLKNFTKDHNIRFSIGELEGYEILFPTNLSILYDKKSKENRAVLVTFLWKNNDGSKPTIIPFSQINEYLNI